MSTRKVRHDYPIRLPLADLRRLLSENDLKLGVSSPLRLINSSQKILEDACDGRPGLEASLSLTDISQDLRAKGALVQSLRIISSPRARFRSVTIAPGVPPLWSNYFTDGEQFVLAYVYRDWFYVALPVTKEEISRLLTKQFTPRTEKSRSSETYLSAHLQLLSLIWRDNESDPDKPISVEQALSALHQAGLNTKQASAAIRSAAAAGCIAARERTLSEALDNWLRPFWSGIFSKLKGKLSMNRDHNPVSNRPKPTRGTMLEVSNHSRYWLRSFWSGSLFVVERKIFANGENDPSRRNPERIVFAGRKGLNIMCRGFRGQDWLERHGLMGRPSLEKLKDYSMIKFEQINKRSAAHKLRELLSVIS